MLTKKIIIVGAGTSGWITASAIKKNHPDLDVTIVHDSKIPTIGVGEALNFGMPSFMRTILGIDDDQWMNLVKATYKVGILHKDWITGQDQYQSAHPLDFPAKFLFKGAFENITQLTAHANLNSVDEYQPHGGIVDLWYTLYQQGKLGSSKKEDLMLYLSEGGWFAKNKRSIRNTAGDWLVSKHHSHSYHYNAELLGSIISELVGKPAGVKVIDSHVTNVEVVDGSIKQLHLKNDQTVSGDLYIDCTGFKRILVSALDYRWIDSDEFSNNSALVCQIKYDGLDHPHHKIAETTTLAAMKQGWRFSIPLQHRSGNGYVFNSRSVKSETEIADEFASALSIDQKDFRTIKWTPGRYENPAKNNCIALGLSQGFTDPYDANNLNLTIKLIRALIKHIDTDKDTWLTDLQHALNHRAKNWWVDIDMRVKSALRLSPRRDLEHYRAMGDFAERTKLREQFIEHICESRKRDYSVNDRTLWPSSVHVVTALRYDIPLPYTEYDTDLEILAKNYFEFNKTKYQILSNRAPHYSDYYQHKT
jgi:hypothetical protein